MPEDRVPEDRVPEDRVPEDRVPEDAVPEAGLLVITSDAKGVVMHRQDLRPATRKASERTPGSKLGTRLSKGEKRNRKRMATVAAVYSVAAQVRTPEQMLAVLAREEEAERKSPPRPRPQHKRVWASLEQEPREVLQEAFREALQRDRQGNQRWVAVVDGNKTQLTILKELAQHHGVQLTIVLDIFHVLEYLWKAGHALAAEGSAELEQWVLHRLGRVLEGRARHVAAGMRRSATKRRVATRKREPVDRCANYLLKYQGYLAYDEYLAAGFPIGSGVIEGACRHLVNDRLGITGARWRLRAAEAVLRLRALRSSGDFDDYWEVPRGAGVAAYPSAALRRRTVADAPAAEQRAPACASSGTSVSQLRPQSSSLAHYPNNSAPTVPAYVPARASVPSGISPLDRCAQHPSD